jgi:hypothetical protein
MRCQPNPHQTRRRVSERVGTATTRYVYNAASELCWTTTATLPTKPVVRGAAVGGGEVREGSGWQVVVGGAYGNEPC